jgi:anaerobic glycerol-3-phosphate dehydrogenase
MLYRLKRADPIGTLKQTNSSEGNAMDRKEIILALILVCLLGIAGKMDYNDAQAESELTHRAEVTR